MTFTVKLQFGISPGKVGYLVIINLMEADNKHSYGTLRLLHLPWFIGFNKIAEMF